MSYWTSTHTASKTDLCSSISWRNCSERIAKLLIRLLKVSCRARERLLNTFTVGVSQGLRILSWLFCSPRYPRSAIIRLPFGIFSFKPPSLRYIAKSEVPAGKGPLTQTTVLSRISIAISYANPGPWNLWEHHFALGFFLGSLIRQWVPSSVAIKTAS